MALIDEYQIRRSTDASMMSFAKLGLPLPDQIVYKPYAIMYERADNSRVGDGYPSLTWTWDVISRSKLATLLTLLDGAEYTNVRIRTDIRDGVDGNAPSAFRTFDAIMWKPDLGGNEGIMIARSHQAYQTVIITFRKLEGV
jgi:hypothetical protein